MARIIADKDITDSAGDFVNSDRVSEATVFSPVESKVASA